MAALTCAKCGFEATGDDKFCTGCGVSFKKHPPSKMETQKAAAGGGKAAVQVSAATASWLPGERKEWMKFIAVLYACSVFGWFLIDAVTQGAISNGVLNMFNPYAYEYAYESEGPLVWLIMAIYNTTIVFLFAGIGAWLYSRYQSRKAVQQFEI